MGEDCCVYTDLLPAGMILEHEGKIIIGTKEASSKKEPA